MMTAQAEKKRERQSGIELLRLLAGLAVIILHFNFRPEGGGAADAASGLNRTFLIALECLCICAVNIFILISGYFSCDRESIQGKKLVLLLLQTVFFQVLAVGISGFSQHSWSMKSFIGALIPVNYYVILYVVMMLFSPFINRLLNHLDSKALTRLVLLAFCVFSVITTVVEVVKNLSGTELAGLSPVGLDGSMGGYSIVNFVMVYLLGAYLRKSNIGKKWNTGMLLLMLTGIAVLLFLWYKLLPDTAWMYCNPLVIAEACVFFLLFSKMSFHNKAVNLLAPATFTCYLIHGTILARMDLEAYGVMSFPALAGILVLTLSGIYIISFGMMLIWNRISETLAKSNLIPRMIINASGSDKDEKAGSSPS